MRYVADSFAWQEKDWFDQPLHFCAGSGGAMLITLPMRVWWVALLAFVVVVGFAAWREYKQHPETQVVFDLDLLFVVLGVVYAIYIMLF